jgi:hypothetical protein
MDAIPTLLNIDLDHFPNISIQSFINNKELFLFDMQLYIAKIGVTIIKSLPRHQKDQFFNLNIDHNCQILSYLFSNGGKIYICTIAALLQPNSMSCLCLFIDDNYPGLHCWGDKANEYLGNIGYHVQGNYIHFFFDYKKFIQN